MAVSLNPQDRRKLDEMRRIKFLATTVLVVCFFTLIITKLLAANYPSLAIIAAFAEAATIGGLADWYAVVALFKRPMGLPIPPTQRSSRVTKTGLQIILAPLLKRTSWRRDLFARNCRKSILQMK